MPTLLDYAKSFIGKPYLWGQNSLVAGADCSGFVLEILRAFGFNLQDATSHDLYKWCERQGFKSKLEPGSLLFFGSINKINHIAIAINRDLMIEAGGGDSTTKTITDAINKNAMVRIRPINRRKDLVAIYLPKYPCL